MKYLKYCKNDIIGREDEQQFIGIVAGQPKHGPTVIFFYNPNIGVSGVKRCAYTGKNIFKEDESPIQYTWRYEYYNGHPAIIVNFSRIDNGYRDNIICLESNNMAKGSGTDNIIPKNKYKLKGENNNRALNVFNDNQINSGNKGFTWYRLGDMQLNKDYPIYITVPTRYTKWADNMVFEEGKTDWEVRINIRPTIRGTLSENYQKVDKTFIFRHTNHIPAKDYMVVKFPYLDMYNE